MKIFIVWAAFIANILACLPAEKSHEYSSSNNGSQSKQISPEVPTSQKESLNPEKEQLKIFPVGEGAGLIGASPQLMENSEDFEDDSEGFGLAEDLEWTKIIAGTIIAGVGIKAGSSVLNSKQVKGIQIETGLGHVDYAAKKAHFQKKAAFNMKKIQTDETYAFTEIKFDATTMNRSLSGHHGKPSLKGEGKIVLGILPDDDLLKQAQKALGGGKTSVLSAVEGFELKSPFQYKVKNSDGSIETRSFKAFNKDNLDGAWAHIRTPDYRPVPGGLIDQGADFIHSQIKQGHNVFVHCKSGKGRSATMVAAYLIKYRNLSADEAIQLVYNQRKHVSIAKTGIFGGHNQAIKRYADDLKHGEYEFLP
ncbi:MAG: dual specificity protein phosphatase family protein [Oligoflexales bacterium]|nr:dual specificity protein phosphatase family protein [Oligoflexales bacterium]